MTVVDRFIQAVSHGGSQRPTLIVVHSAETPLRAGYAYSIAANWFGASASTSAHFMVDPAECIRMLSDNVVAYHVGPAANGFTLGIEQAGYARLSRAEWTTDDGMNQLRTVGALIAECCDRWGIPKRWASDEQIRAARYGTPAGVCFHDDIRRVLGGTVHYDPMPNYPRDLLEHAWNNPGEDDMPSAQEVADALLNSVITMPDGSKAALRTVVAATRQSQKSQQADLDDIQARLVAIEEAVSPPAGLP